MGHGLFLVVVIVSIFSVVYFFSFQVQKIFGSLANFLARRVGMFSVNREYAIQRYIFLHRGSLVAKLYDWINEQIVAVGLKRIGVSPVGYFLFWTLLAAVADVWVIWFSGIRLVFLLPLFILFLVCSLVTTRVIVSERIEYREGVIMDALDLIIPEVKGGIKNAILKYTDNFDVSIRGDFRAFITNMQDRGYSFNDAMFILADNLGEVFRDFAQKAIYFEAIGEPDMQTIFDDIIETNRLRRDLRTTNRQEFKVLKVSFVASCLMVFGYFLFLMATDSFSRYFFLHTTIGNIALIVSLVIVFSVLSYLSTVKSRTL